MLKQVAREHRWQTNHAPDARVLLLLGLGNKWQQSNPDVLDEILNMKPTVLEPGLLAEYKAARAK